MSCPSSPRHRRAKIFEPKDHNLVIEAVCESGRAKACTFEKRPVKDTDGKPVAGLFNAWITLDNPSQFNSYTTDMVKGDHSRFSRRERGA
jgi:hypothetical protein